MSSSARHVIRLRQPWDVIPTDPGQSPPQQHHEVVRFRRRFGSPTGLETDDQVDLVIEGVASNGRVWLNQKLLGALSRAQTARFSLLRQLAARNELLIELELSELGNSRHPCAPPAFADLVGEVRIEIM